MDSKKVKTLVYMSIPTTLSRSKFLMEWHNFIGVLSKKLHLLCHQSPNYSRSLKLLNGPQNVRLFGRRLKSIYTSPYLD
jgi:hypothetical protein